MNCGRCACAFRLFFILSYLKPIQPVVACRIFCKNHHGTFQIYTRLGVDFIGRSGQGGQSAETLVLVRHGESEYNAARAGNPYFLTEEAVRPVKGIPDHKIALTAKGRMQATITGQWLIETFGMFDVVYHSNYLRTIETAANIVSLYSKQMQAMIRVRGDSRLRERQPGYSFHMTKAEVDRHFPYFEEYLRTTGYFYAIPPGGESQAQVCDRVFLSIGRWFQYYAGQHMFVSGHAGTIRDIRYCLEKWTPDQYEQSVTERPGHNCGVWVYKFDENTKRLELVVEDRVCYDKSLA